MHSADDPYLWLEDVQGDAALAWVRERNAQSQQVLEAVPGFEALRDRLRQLLDATDRIPYVTRRGAWLYNFWQDRQHPRGLWRRTTLAAYRQPQPAWETVLDLDALAAAEGEPWVWGSADSLGPAHRRCLLSLSRGGADAKVMREFDIEAKAFVDGGFVLAEGKSSVEWIDADTVYVGTDTGPGSMTDSGYPRTVRRWRRGTPLASAGTVFEGHADDVSVSAWVDDTPGFERHFFTRAIDFYRQEHFVLEGERLVRLKLPDDAHWSLMHSAGVDGEILLLELRSELSIGMRTYPSGALLAADARGFWANNHSLDGLQFQMLFEPSATRSLAGFTTTCEHVVIDVLDNVASRLEEWRRTSGGFVQRAIVTPSPGRLSVASLHDPQQRDDPLAENYTLQYTDFLTPDSLSLARTGSDERELLKAIAPAFDATGMRAEQHFATSADGTRVPYFVVWPRDVRSDGGHPTLLYGYGGFRIALAPWYAGATGNAWCARGGVLVVANIRGGGEYGPAWHQAAVREHKQRSCDDFIAVAEDLIARGISRAPQLGIQGGSNGGLLVGAAFTQRPDLFGAVVCQVPLLDMKRYHQLLAGASWMAEYGDPDQPDDWAFISRYSPYHRVQAGVSYPSVLFTTSTRDDRVHPGHARKMAARMLAQGHAPLYFENIEGGHGLAADNAQRAHVQALEFSHLWRALSR